MLSSHFLGCRSSLVAAQENKHPCNKCNFLLLAFSAEQTLRGLEYPFGELGSAALAVCSPQDPPPRSPVREDAGETALKLLSSSQTTGELSSPFWLPVPVPSPALRGCRGEMSSSSARPSAASPGWNLPAAWDNPQSLIHLSKKWETKIAHSSTFQQIWFETCEVGGPWLTADMHIPFAHAELHSS